MSWMYLSSTLNSVELGLPMIRRMWSLYGILKENHQLNYLIETCKILNLYPFREKIMDICEIPHLKLLAACSLDKKLVFYDLLAESCV